MYESTAEIASRAAATKRFADMPDRDTSARSWSKRFAERESAPDAGVGEAERLDVLAVPLVAAVEQRLGVHDLGEAAEVGASILPPLGAQQQRVGSGRGGDLRRLALDIEVMTTEGHEFPSAARPGDRIIAIALADTTGFRHVVRGDRLDERALLEECTRIIRERDPDVIEGHNIFRFDLEYLEARARLHRLTLGWGRGGESLRSRVARLQIAERTIGYRRYEVAGQCDEIDFMVDRGLEHISRGSKGGLDEEISQMIGHFGQPSGRPFQVKVRRVQKSSCRNWQSAPTTSCCMTRGRTSPIFPARCT